MSHPSHRFLFAAALSACLAAGGVGHASAAAPSADAPDGALQDESPLRARRDAARREAEARKAKHDEAAPAAAEPARYPQATRKEPGTKASPNATPVLQKIITAYNANDPATVTSLADSVLADPKANDYDRAFAARMAGVAALKTDPARATEDFKRALQFNGLDNNDHYQTMSVLAQLQMQAEQYADALATLDRFFAETHAQDADLLALKGNALYRLNRYPEAEAALTQAIAAAPQPHPDWMELLMGAYSAGKQPAEAARIADQLSAKFPDDKQVQANLAAVYLQGGENEKAIAILEKLRAAGQLTAEKDYHNLYALYFELPGKEPQAIQVIKEGLDKGVLKPDYENYRALAQGYYLTGQTAASIEAYRNAAPLAADGEGYLNLAKALLNSGKAAEASHAAQQALDKGVKDPAQARKIVGQKGK